MDAFISAENLAQSLGGKDIFSGITFEVHSGEKLAIVGPNGVGKSSLLRIIAGNDQAVEGRLKQCAFSTCSLLNQHFDNTLGLSVREALEKSSAASTLQHSVGEALKKFGFTGAEEQLIAELSGGEKTRLQLARIWLSGAELLLLDEPTNHLDTANLDWLEEFINEYPHTVILVSHDRYFLDRTVKRVLELRPDGITSYPGNYSAYYQAKMTKLACDEKTFWEQEKAAQKLSHAISEQKHWAGQAHEKAAVKARESGIKSSKVYYRNKAKKSEQRVKNNINRLERLEKERIERPKAARSIDLSFTSGTRASKGILLAEGLSKHFNQRSLFANGKFDLRYGEKVALLGNNGAGKTTMLRMIAGLEPLDEGEMWTSPSLRLGYLDQELQTLDGKRTVLDELLAIHYDPRRVRTLLADLLLSGETVFKPCAVLSMGERVRVAMAKLLLGTYDLLLLDEPGNYLDLPSREKLEQALEVFGGSLILVSHDRYMVERVAGTIWAIENGEIKVYPGRYSAYRDNCLAAQVKPTALAPERLELEIKKSRLISHLSLLDRSRNEAEYLRLEKEFLETLRRLQE